MRVRFWGTRGSIPTPGPDTVRYGGNTSCVEERTDGGEVLVLDCGTGARALGASLVAEAAADGTSPSGSILIGHTHWDHIHGLPFFAPLFVPGSRWDLYGPRGIVRTLDGVLAGQMEYQYFPVGLDEVAAEVAYHDLVEGVFEIGDATIRTRYLNHPALTLAYRIEVGGAVLVYATDHEPYDVELAAGGEPGPDSGDGRHAGFFAGADVLVHDAQYDAVSYPSKVGWGHSPMEYVVALAASVGVRTLVLFHHDPARDDDAVDAMLQRARGIAADEGSGMVVEAAAEGSELDVVAGTSGKRSAPDAVSATRIPALEHLDVRVVVASRDQAFASAVEAAARAEGLGTRSPEDLADHTDDTIVILDVDDDRPAEPPSGAATVIGATRQAVPKVVSHVSDWIVLPCSIAHLRTKLHAAVLRRACRWTAAPLPPDEEHRLEALRALEILDTPPEGRFDRLTEMARQATDTPIALVTLVDAERQWFKSHAGFPVSESPRDESMCAHAILGDDVLVIPDTLEDDRFADNPAVTGPARIRFYAGVPLVLGDGSRVGTLCVGDHRPRLLDEHQLDELRRLAALVVEELQARAH
jgi:phosphoribosyl 1,2-cyclic phosphodiesterase